MEDDQVINKLIRKHSNPKLFMGHISGPRSGYYVKTGEFRAPQNGEYYLSGAIPVAYRALDDLSIEYNIMRPATHEEEHCWWCGQFRHDKVER